MERSTLVRGETRFSVDWEGTVGVVSVMDAAKIWIRTEVIRSVGEMDSLMNEWVRTKLEQGVEAVPEGYEELDLEPENALTTAPRERIEEWFGFQAIMLASLNESMKQIMKIEREGFPPSFLRASRAAYWAKSEAERQELIPPSVREALDQLEG